MTTSSINKKPYIRINRVTSVGLPEPVICGLCEGILWEPMGCNNDNCETPYCASCIKNQQTDSVESIPCPTGCSGYMKNRCSMAIIRLLRRVEVKCVNTEYGCNQILLYDSLEAHENQCDYEQKQCSGCAKYFCKKDFDDHQNACQLVEIICPDCDSCFERKNKPKHTEIVCLRVQVKKLASQVKILMDERNLSK